MRYILAFILYVWLCIRIVLPVYDWGFSNNMEVVKFTPIQEETYTQPDRSQYIPHPEWLGVDGIVLAGSAMVGQEFPTLEYRIRR